MNTTNFSIQPKRLIASLVAGTMLLHVWIPAWAEVAQTPAVMTVQPDSNVMFTLDDSGSMASDVIPDLTSNTGLPATNSGSATYYLTAKYPLMWAKDSKFLHSDYYENGATTGDSSRFLRSSASNPIYYDRTVTYSPWPDPAADTTAVLADANPAAVKISKTDPRSSTVDNTIDLTKQMTGSSGNKFWPATYYVYTSSTPYDLDDGRSAAQNKSANFTKVEINSGVGTYTRSANDSRTDCGTGATCTYKQEVQNFANWLQYYRNRMLMAKGGVALAFSKQGTNLRVGLATINAGVVRGVLQFDSPDRDDFYTGLYGRGLSTYTPLRKALQTVGDYFTVPKGASAATRLKSPYASKPGVTLEPEYDCRKSYNILSTDGYWNDAAATGEAAKDQDNFAAGEAPPDRADGKKYKWSDSDGLFAINPFSSTKNAQSNTLSDVAAYYWRTDLYPDLANNVSPSTRDPAHWQHMTTFTVGLGVTGTGAVAGLDDPVVRAKLIADKTKIAWPTITSDTPSTGDDLIRASMVGHGRFFAATAPTVLANGISSALAEAADQPLSLSTIAPASTTYFDGARVYQGTFNASQWYGRLYAFQRGITGAINTSPSEAIWEAASKMPPPNDRTIYSFNPTTGKASFFDFSANGLTAAQKLTIDTSSDLLAYLRGDASNEESNKGSFRNRAHVGTNNGVLGDIVNSTPINDVNMSMGYTKLPSGTPGADSYASFRTGLPAEYRNTIFVGANDGMLHAFNSVDGVERFAFVPNSVFSVPRVAGASIPEKKLKMLSDPGYKHVFTVDGPPQLSDAYQESTAKWRSMLNGTTGAGARSIFVLDVSNPSPTAKADTFDRSKILWEFSDTTLTDGGSMGFNLQYGHTARMANGQWALIFANGYDSVSGKATVFIRDLYTGAHIAKLTPNNATANGSGNGMSQPNFVTKDRIAQTIYAGDLKGNMWKFDVSDKNPSNWGSAFKSGSTDLPLYTTPAKQPITVMPALGFHHPNGGTMVIFGTGKLFETTDLTDTSTPQQAIYGIWDKPGPYVAFTGLTELVAQTPNTLLSGGTDTSLNGYTANTIDWTKFRGWYINLKTDGERVNVIPQLTNPNSKVSPVAVVANTPAPATPCKSGGSARIFYLDPYSGGAPAFAVVDANQNGSFDNADRGYNVWSIGTLISRPILQAKGEAPGNTLSDFADGRTGINDGGREITNASTNCTSGNRMLATVGKSDTGTESKEINLCPNTKGRISWRQIQ